MNDVWISSNLIGLSSISIFTKMSGYNKEVIVIYLTSYQFQTQIHLWDNGSFNRMYMIILSFRRTILRLSLVTKLKYWLTFGITLRILWQNKNLLTSGNVGLTQRSETCPSMLTKLSLIFTKHFQSQSEVSIRSRHLYLRFV